MVKGLEIFKTSFRDFADKYILIGGAACDVLFTQAGLPFRATKDLDIVLAIEALDAVFIKQFWHFIKIGGYQMKQKGEKQRKYYRFQKPTQKDYPSQLELFARNPDWLDLAENTHLAPIPVEEDLSSLSAILFDEDYYRFVLEQSMLVDDLHVATELALICLKAKAFLDLKALKRQGVQINERDIKKHKNDVVRLSVLLPEETTLKLPDSVNNDMRIFISILTKEPPDVQLIAKHMGLPPFEMKTILTKLNQICGIT